jgi:hypothetical protein
MKNNGVFWVILLGIVVGGFSYWFNAYNQLFVAGINIYHIMGIGAFLGSIIMSYSLSMKPSKIALSMSIGIIIAILVRIFFDVTFIDSTSHNLAPFEIIIAACIVFPSAFVGSLLSKLVALLRKRR